MQGYGPASYGDAIADHYDDQYDDPRHDAVLPTGDVAAAVACLALQAGAGGGGPVLELGVGTGRIAIPLAATGLEVHGVDASVAMLARLTAKLARLAAKPGGAAVVGIEADFTTLADGPPLGLVYVVFNTFFALADQDTQVACLASVARRLRPGGRFVIEAFVPDPSRFDRGQRVAVTSVEVDQVRLDVSLHDAAAQLVEGHHVIITETGTRLVPFVLRYVWPSELDLMARLAGLTRVERWSTWDGAPFDAASGAHVSVYQRSH